jgi:hypothetical protein
MSLRSLRRPLLGLSLSFPLLIAASPAHAGSTPLPASDAKVLDYMADWQGDDGQWVDPMTFARIDPAKVKADAARRHGKPTPAAVSKPAPAAGTTEARDVR